VPEAAGQGKALRRDGPKKKASSLGFEAYLLTLGKKEKKFTAITSSAEDLLKRDVA